MSIATKSIFQKAGERQLSSSVDCALSGKISLMTREQVNQFIETVRRIREGDGPLSQYFDREIAESRA